MRWSLLVPVLLATVVLCPVMAADSVTIVADRDATLIEDPNGAWANGTGPLFAGRTAQSEGSRRRAVIRFDLEHALPDRAIVESVELRLFAGPSHRGGRVACHRLLADWSEGSAFSGGGGGSLSQPGDATWVHTRFPLDRWVRPGGHFVARPSALATVNLPGAHTWIDSRHLVEDVRLWQHNPSRNFGWILIGDESRPQSAIPLSSREDPDPGIRPQLRVTYRMPAR